MSETPKPFMTGTFSLYETPEGGYHLAYRPKDAEEDQHVEIPGMYLKLAKMNMGKGLMKKLGMGM